MEFKNFNRDFRRNVTTTSPEVSENICVDGVLQIDELYDQGDKAFINRKCPNEGRDCLDKRYDPPRPYEKPGQCLEHANAVLKARAWVTSNRCDDSAAENEEQAHKIRVLTDLAKEAIRAADLKNLRKRIALYDPDSKSPQAGHPIPQWMSERHDALKKKPSYTHTRSTAGPQGRVPRRVDLSPRTSRRRASTVHWEEVKGPDGRIILFELLFENGRFVGRRRASSGQFPEKGNIVLDTTARGEGFKVWRIRGTRRRPMPKTPQMQAIYESSFLYKVRQLAAGQISVQELHDATRMTGPDAVWSEAGQFGMGTEAPQWLK